MCLDFDAWESKPSKYQDVEKGGGEDTKSKLRVVGVGVTLR